MIHLFHSLALQYITLPRLGVATTVAAGWPMLASASDLSLSTFEKYGLPGLVIGLCALLVWWLLTEQKEQRAAERAEWEQRELSLSNLIVQKEAVIAGQSAAALAHLKEMVAALNSTAVGNTELAKAVTAITSEMAATREHCRGNRRAHEV